MRNRGRSPWAMVALLFLTATAGYVCRVNISTAGVLLMEEFRLSQVEMGRVFSAFLLGYALFQVPGGWVADRWGARRVLMAAAFAWVALTAVTASAGLGPLVAGAPLAIGSLLMSRFLLGVAAAPTYPGAAQGVSVWVPSDQQGRATGVVLASIGVGSALAPPLVSGVMVEWGWRAALLVSATPALALALIWLWVKEPSSGTGRRAPVTPVKHTPAKEPRQRLRSRSFILLSASYTLQGYVGYIFVFWFFLYLVQERQFDLLQGAWASTLPWVLSIVSIPLGGWLSDKLVAGRLGPVWGRRAVPLAGMAASGFLISVGAHTQSPLMAVLALALATSLVLCVEGPFWSTMISLAPSRTGTGGGIMNMGSNVGGLISPAFTPVLAQFIGWEGALHVAAGLAVLAAALWFGISPGAPEPEA